jgi:hypothetical protein
LTRLGPLAEREFRLLFLGRAVSFLGNAMAPIALAFAVLQLAGSKSDLGFVLAARSAPQIVFILIGGVWADRLKRNHVMVASSLLSGASQGTLAVLLLSRDAQLWHLLAISAVNGTSSSFFFPASAGIVPQTVPPVMIQQANALVRLALNSSLVIGAAAGGGIVAAAGPGWAIAVDAATFGAGALFAGTMRLPSIEGAETPSFLDELAEGWRVPLANLALGDRAPVFRRQRGKHRRVPGARAGAGEGALGRGGCLGRDPCLRVRGADPRWSDDAPSPTTTDASRRHVRRARSGAPARAARPAGPGGGDCRGRLCDGLRDRDLLRELGHDDAAADSGRDALARLLVRRTRIDRADSCRLRRCRAARRPDRNTSELYGAAALVVAATLRVFAVRDVRELRRK